MAGYAKTEGLERLRKRALQIMPKAARDQMRKANQATADDFAGTLRRIIARGEPRGGHLVDTVKVEDVDEVAVKVTLGDAAHPYPMHLETGHRAADGTHVPAKPAYFPARRLAKKKHKGRAARALKKAVTITAGGG